MDLNKKTNIELTVAERVLVRDALRGYVEKIQGYVRESLNVCEYAAAAMHEQRIADAIEVFGKMCEEE